MHNFLRILTEDGTVQYLNMARIERIEIRQSLTEATVFMVDKPSPIPVRGEHYFALIEYLGNDQECRHSSGRTEIRTANFSSGGPPL